MKHRGVIVAVSAGVLATLALGSTAAAFAAKSVSAESTRATSVASAPSTLRTPPRALPGGCGWPGDRGRVGPGGMMGAGIVEVVLKLTGQSTSTIVTARQSGKSFATIAKAKGVTVAQIIDLAMHAPTAALASEVSDGLMTRAQADKALADMKTRLTEELNETAARGPAEGRRPHGAPPASASGSSSSASGTSGDSPSNGTTTQ